jgi:aspartate kinase
MAVTDFERVPVVASDEPRAHAGIVVMKFGGTSVATPDRIRAVAQRLVDAQRHGRRVVAVLSAMGRSTDDLVRLAHQVSAQPQPRELDMLVSTGERISCALCAMAVIDLGSRAVSLTGSQAGIVTDTVHGKAKIVEVRARRIHEALEEGRIVLVAGFQGVSTDHEVTTLGRGASDTTAVALAAALGAGSCEIYTDVDGVHTADPGIAPDARKLAAVTYDEMLELAASGARVLALRSVELARNQAVRLHVRSAFVDADGTWVTEEGEGMPEEVVDGMLEPVLERAMIAGVAHTLEETVYRVEGVRAARLFSALADEQVNVDTIVQTGPEIVFSAPNADRVAAGRALEALGATWHATDDLGKVSVVGAGMKSHPGVAAAALSALEAAGIEPRVVSTSPIKISVHVGQGEVERAVLALHTAFGLGAGDGS